MSEWVMSINYQQENNLATKYLKELKKDPLLQCLERLRTGVVKLSRLTYFQCTGPQQQDFLYIVLFHLS